MDQHNLNQEMLDLGVQRYRKNRTTNKGSLTNAGRRIMREGVEPVTLGLTYTAQVLHKNNRKKDTKAFPTPYLKDVIAGITNLPTTTI